MEYWEIINNNLSNEAKLGQKAAMRRLNDARKNLKHRGTRPDTADIDSFSVAVQNFFEESTPLIFGIEYSEISLVNLVEYRSTRERLNEAQEYLSEGDNRGAIKKLAIAYDDLFMRYNQRMKSEFGYEPFSIDNSAGAFLSKGRMEQEYGKNMGRFFENVDKSISAVEDAIQVLSLGMDYRRFSKFDSLTPRVLRSIGGDISVANLPEDREITDEDVKFCLDFVVETAIKLQKRDATDVFD